MRQACSSDTGSAAVAAPAVPGAARLLAASAGRRPRAQAKGARLVAVTSVRGCRLEAACDMAVHLPLERELCPWGLAPVTSAAAQMLFGDTVAIALMQAHAPALWRARSRAHGRAAEPPGRGRDSGQGTVWRGRVAAAPGVCTEAQAAQRTSPAHASECKQPRATAACVAADSGSLAGVPGWELWVTPRSARRRRSSSRRTSTR